MKTVHKYPLAGPMRHTQLYLPTGFKFLAYRIQRGGHTIWMEVTPVKGGPESSAEFVIVGTGHLLDSNFPHYLGTVEDHDGLIWHLYSDTSP